jgi:hypothetical protein
LSRKLKAGKNPFLIAKRELEEEDQGPIITETIKTPDAPPNFPSTFKNKMSGNNHTP